MPESSHLLPDRHPETDMFFCDIADAVIKDAVVAMEHPIFVLTKQPYMNRRRYENGENWLEVVPSDKGIANIYDKDILIFAISQIMAAKNAGKPYSKDVSFVAIDFLKFSNKKTGGRDYRALQSSLERLKGTVLQTNLVTNGEQEWRAFGLVDSVTIRKEHLDGRILEWGITLSDWLFKAVEANEVLTLNPSYFLLKKPLERRLYEIARKHCGKKKEWRIGIELLQKKCGSNSSKKHFKSTLKTIIKHQHLPDYLVDIINDTVVFNRFGEVGKSATVQMAGADYNTIKPLRTTTYEKFKASHPRYDVHHIEQEWRTWAYGKEPPKMADLAFLKWAETWVENHPLQENYTN